jgi:hypothetical protein
MSRHGDITFEWGHQEQRFRLAIGELRKLQERVDAGPYELLRRLTSGTWRVDDIRETIRLGLAGGGADDATVRRLLRDHVDEKPLLDSVMVAARILEAAIAGAPDEPLPKGEGEAETKASPSPTESSPILPSSDGDQSSAIAP